GQRDVAGEPGPLVADRILGHLHEDRVARLERLLDRAGLALQARRVPVHLAGVEHGVTPPADVDERGLHARQDVLHLAEIDVAGHRRRARAAHVVLDQHPILEHRDLGALTGLADHHDPVDRLAPGEELRLGQDRRPGAPLFTAIAAALALRLQPGGAGHPLYFVGARPRLTDLDDGGDAVLDLDLDLAGGALAPPPAPAPGHRLCLLRLLGGLRGGLLVEFSGFQFLLGGALPPAPAPSAPPAP